MLDNSAKTLFEKELEVSGRNVVRIAVAVQQEPEKGAPRELYELAIAWYSRTRLCRQGEGATATILRYTKSQLQRVITVLDVIQQRKIPDIRSIVLGVPIGSCTVLCGGPAELKFDPSWGGMYHVEPDRLSAFVRLLKEAIAAVDHDERRVATSAVAAASVPTQLPPAVTQAQASGCAHQNRYLVQCAGCPDCSSPGIETVMIEEENLAAEAGYTSKFPASQCSSCGWSNAGSGNKDVHYISEYHCADCGSAVRQHPNSSRWEDMWDEEFVRDLIRCEYGNEE